MSKFQKLLGILPDNINPNSFPISMNLKCEAKNSSTVNHAAEAGFRITTQGDLNLIQKCLYDDGVAENPFSLDLSLVTSHI